MFRKVLQQNVKCQLGNIPAQLQLDSLQLLTAELVLLFALSNCSNGRRALVVLTAQLFQRHAIIRRKNGCILGQHLENFVALSPALLNYLLRYLLRTCDHVI